MKKSEEIIDALAWRYIKYLPPISSLDLDDLKQEGWIEYLSCINLYKKKGGANFHTFLWACVSNRLKNVTRGERRYRKHVTGSHTTHKVKHSNITPEREVMTAQAIQKLTEVDEDLGKMVSEGVPDELYS